MRLSENGVRQARSQQHSGASSCGAGGPEERFADGRQAVEELRTKAAMHHGARSSDAARARALQRLAAERGRTRHNHTGGRARPSSADRGQCEHLVRSGAPAGTPDRAG